MKGIAKLWLITILIEMMIQSPLIAYDPEDIQYKFSLTDSTLVFHGSFRTVSSPDCLLEIFFNYNHIKALASEGMEVQLVDQGTDWSLIRYKFRRFIFFENTSEWQRKLNRENQVLDIKLVSSVNNQAAMPRMISSSGSFKVREQGDEIIVEYHQSCRLTKTLITELFLKILRNEAIQFMQKLMEYTNTNCIDKPVK
ncbi:MAG: hypothetical protein V1903_06280 [Bacteroidota bacterium]